ncbi:hypothetical protein LY78DRAFT_692509 [Colletotrichum sublineola]|uniref:Uncharacterized protein n=1 Tax=Colletotrichum sublineola TaxID=1173701 RepID=A0A066XPT8_COLSU|nr:hypothetical protein LY78DRAFT_692509 [Colletotrichum sublineola]KDN70912.1 hypothetical protein CSUB01_03726 [Colletotrichum sublineola]
MKKAAKASSPDRLGDSGMSDLVFSSVMDLQQGKDTVPSWLQGSEQSVGQANNVRSRGENIVRDEPENFSALTNSSSLADENDVYRQYLTPTTSCRDQEQWLTPSPHFLEDTGLAYASKGLRLPSISNTPSFHYPKQAKHDQMERACVCLQSVIFILDELETGQDISIARGVDVTLSTVKEALSHSQALVRCLRCRVRPENLTVLAMLTDRLAKLCELSVDELQKSNLCERREVFVLSQTGDEQPPLNFCIGRYEIDTGWEWNAIMGSLAVGHVKGLLSMVDEIKQLSQEVCIASVYTKLVAVQERLFPLLTERRSSV